MERSELTLAARLAAIREESSKRAMSSYWPDLRQDVVSVAVSATAYNNCLAVIGGQCVIANEI